ncbi:MAG: putative toxin-antitoxin system toxin component, PIN family [Candidatus Woesearchaeota archaeon]|nr:putative toxin-antitoxin system toxin component, PIN family [Candidatus Woesearchaeota archaeon]
MHSGRKNVVVLDTNVLLSGTFWKGDSYEILKRAKEKRIALVLSISILEEYKRILESEEIIEKQAQKNLQASHLATSLANYATIITCETIPGIVPES